MRDGEYEEAIKLINENIKRIGKRWFNHSIWLTVAKYQLGEWSVFPINIAKRIKELILNNEGNKEGGLFEEPSLGYENWESFQTTFLQAPQKRTEFNDLRSFRHNYLTPPPTPIVRDFFYHPLNEGIPESPQKSDQEGLEDHFSAYWSEE